MDPITIAALATAAAKVVGGIIASGKHKKYAEAISRTKMTMPESMLKAEEIYKMMSNMGLPGYAKYKSDIEATMPSVMTQAKEVVDNPATLLGMLSNTQTQQEDALSKLSVQDATQRLANEGQYAGFLAGPKATVERQMEEFENQKLLGRHAEQMLGTKELMSGIEQGVSSGISTYGNLSMLKYMQGQKTDWQKFLDEIMGESKRSSNMISESPVKSTMQIQQNQSAPLNMNPRGFDTNITEYPDFFKKSKTLYDQLMLGYQANNIWG